MSLLMDYKDQRFIEIAQAIYDEQFRRDPQLAREMDERRRQALRIVLDLIAKEATRTTPSE